MKLGDLEVFVEVVEAGGMTQAAALRGSSQPAISRTIRELESRLNAPLLRRTGRGVEMTPAGKRFLDFARQTLADYAEMQRAVQSLAGALPSELSIAVPLRTGRLLVPALHKRFALALPEINVQIFDETSARMAEALHSHQYDMGIIYGDGSAPVSGQQPLYTERLYLVGAEAVIGPADEPVTLAEVARQRLLLPGKAAPFRKLVDSHFRRRDLTPNTVRELEVSEAVLSFALEGEGVAILPYSNVYRECQRGELAARPIVEPSIERSVNLAVSPQADRRLAGIASRIIRDVLPGIAAQARWMPAARG